jgi:hypothetical protein
MRSRLSVKLAPLVILVSVVMPWFQMACKSGDSKVAPYPISKLNPYRGAIKDLLPTEVGEYRLVDRQSLAETGVELSNPVDGAGGIYNTPGHRTVQHLLVNFASAIDANKELDHDLKRYKSGNQQLALEEVKDVNGQVIGRRITVKNGDTEALSWTNGSLYCSVVSYVGYSSEFARNLPY